MNIAKISWLGLLLVFADVVLSEENGTLEALWNLTGYAIQSRQRFQEYPNHPVITSNYPDRYKQINNLQKIKNGGIVPMYAVHYSNYQRFPYYQNQQNHNLNTAMYPLHYPQNQGHYDLQRPHQGYPSPYLGYPQQNKGPLSSFLPSREAFMEALDSIARNDELHCVPRILCEVTSGTLSARQSGLKLPFNINMESVVGLLSGFNGVELNPLLSFGKAAILGYSSKGNAGTCMYAYPECPRDPEKLVDYLNNYNGGFFRFFNGIHPQYQHNQLGFNPQYQQNQVGIHPHYQHNQIYQQGPHHFQQRPPYLNNYNPGIINNRPYDPYRVYNYKANKAEKRILTRPTEFDNTSNRFPDVRQQKGIKFPNDLYEFSNELYPSNNFHNAERLRTLKFPIRDEDTGEGPLRKPKRLLGFFGGDETNFQRPSPNHRPNPMIFPDRTGTGELKFTPEELVENFGRPSAFQDNNLISFDSETNNDPFYSSNFDVNILRADYSGMNRLNNRFFPA